MLATQAWTDVNKYCRARYLDFFRNSARCTLLVAPELSCSPISIFLWIRRMSIDRPIPDRGTPFGVLSNGESTDSFASMVLVGSVPSLCLFRRIAESAATPKRPVTSTTDALATGESSGILSAKTNGNATNEQHPDHPSALTIIAVNNTIIAYRYRFYWICRS